ncbi:hypothetical protein N8299_04935 [Gammaproteobacteria bacterium]|nr:hypothetical protein [Gammaproteobacteria bacterium]MDC1326654.1 hypothetical protein [Gammaproteobacteria bacterium]
MSINILFSDNKVESTVTAISHLQSCGTWEAFDARAISFITKFSSLLLKFPSVNKYPDLVVLAYWFRRASIINLSKEYLNDPGIIRMGRGISLHIAPSNVDTIFVYSFFLSLLAGNTSFIRVSQGESPQLKIITQVFKEIYDSGDIEVAGRFVICTYPHESEATKIVSESCELRIIWGGDETVNTITAVPLKPTALELKFPNRTSFSAISLDSLEKINDQDLTRLCSNLYSDVQLFGQQACSSPMAIYFVGSPKKNIQSERFWEFFYIAAKNHDITSSELMDRLVSASSMAISGIINKAKHSFGSKDIVLLDGNLFSKSSFRDGHPGNGFLIQYFISSITDLAEHIHSQDQTLSIFGFDRDEIYSLIQSLENRGLDRIVPIGEALDFSHIWDGVDLLESMSRKIDMSKLSE